MTDQLIAWLYDTPVAVLTSGPDFRIQLSWRDEGIDRWGLGSTALSVGLPIGSPTGHRDMRGLDYFENMLPEGPALAQMAALAGSGRRTPAASSRHSAGTALEPSWCSLTGSGLARTGSAGSHQLLSAACAR